MNMRLYLIIMVAFTGFAPSIQAGFSWTSAKKYAQPVWTAARPVASGYVGEDMTNVVDNFVGTTSE